MKETATKPSLILIPDGVKASDEVLEKRTVNSKTFKVADNKFRILKTAGAVHYKNNLRDDNEPWKEVDLTIDSDGKVSKTHFDLEVWKDKVGYSYTSKKGGRIDVELVEVGKKAVDNSRFTVRQDGNVLWWENVDEGVDLKIIIRPIIAEIFKKLDDKNYSKS